MKVHDPRHESGPQSRVGTVSIMEPRHDEDTRHLPQITPEIIAQMREEMERAKEYDCIEILDSIRKESGIGWAIYASTFMGRDVDGWRAEVCEALNV